MILSRPSREKLGIQIVNRSAGIATDNPSTPQWIYAGPRCPRPVSTNPVRLVACRYLLLM